MVGPGVLASVRLTWVSVGSGECSFCSCCFFWILRCSCCFASTEGDGRVFTWGWNAFASAVGTKAEAGVGVFIPVKAKEKIMKNMQQIISGVVQKFVHFQRKHKNDDDDEKTHFKFAGKSLIVKQVVLLFCVICSGVVYAIRGHTEYKH